MKKCAGALRALMYRELLSRTKYRIFNQLESDKQIPLSEDTVHKISEIIR